VGEGNVELVRQAFAAFTRRDMAAVRELLHPEAEFVAPTGSIAGRTAPYRGYDGLKEYFADVARIWEELEVIPHEYREEGDRVVALGRVYGRGLDACWSTPRLAGYGESKGTRSSRDARSRAARRRLPQRVSASSPIFRGVPVKLPCLR
jgi:SnoaL-like domain